MSFVAQYSIKYRKIPGFYVPFLQDLHLKSFQFTNRLVFSLLPLLLRYFLTAICSLVCKCLSDCPCFPGFVGRLGIKGQKMKLLDSHEDGYGQGSTNHKGQRQNVILFCSYNGITIERKKKIGQRVTRPKAELQQKG